MALLLFMAALLLAMLALLPAVLVLLLLFMVPLLLTCCNCSPLSGGDDTKYAGADATSGGGDAIYGSDSDADSDAWARAADEKSEDRGRCCEEEVCA